MIFNIFVGQLPENGVIVSGQLPENGVIVSKTILIVHITAVDVIRRDGIAQGIHSEYS